MRGSNPWATSDPLGEALHFLRMGGVFYSPTELTAPWGLTMPPMDGCLWFHVVTDGGGWIEMEGAEPRLLQPGDFVLVPHGEGHRLVSEPGVRAPSVLALESEYETDRYAILRHGMGGEASSFICGVVRFDHPAAHHLVSLLPWMIHVGAPASSELDWMQSTLRFIAAETRAPRPGGEAVITRLADILVIQAIRSWIETDPAAQTGWLGALQDRQIGRAISLIHRDPARDWTVAALADELAMSRSAFSARFTALVEEPAMRYVTRWRMHVARDRLREGGATVAELADHLGYRSEAAFSRAFKRVVGVPPGAVRRAGAGSDVGA